jgi:hypothetical protein
MVTCADALEEAVRYHGGTVSSRQVFDYINRKYPGVWKDGTIRAHMMGCSVNHSSSHHYKHFRKFLYSEGPGLVRLYDPEADGKWKWTSDGMIMVESDDEDEPETEEDENGSEVDSKQISLTMEKDLELFLYNDIRSLDPELDLPEELENRQYNVTSGRIDILAKDTDGAYVVIELKAGTAKDQALTQLLAYMGDIAEQFESGASGILVAHNFSDKLVRASKLVPSIKLMKYNISFSFELV